MSNASSFLSGAIVPWVSGTTYAVNRVVTSPADNYQTYIRVVAGAGTTDPSADATNWKPFGARAIKSIQRGVIGVADGNSTGTATVSSVVTAKSVLHFLGSNSYVSGDSTWDGARALMHLQLTNSTTITATRIISSGTAYVSWQLVEYY